MFVPSLLSWFNNGSEDIREEPEGKHYVYGELTF